MSEVFVLTPEEVACACQGSLPPLVVRGLELFNEREYFEAHEFLELAWKEEREPVRELYRGILQISVAYYHILRGNHRGAMKMFLRARNWLAPFPDACRGVDLRAFRVDYGRVEETLKRIGPSGMNAFDHSLLKPIRYDAL